jgi:hypothetical protein
MTHTRPAVTGRDRYAWMHLRIGVGEQLAGADHGEACQEITVPGAEHDVLGRVQGAGESRAAAGGASGIG